MRIEIKVTSNDMDLDEVRQVMATCRPLMNQLVDLCVMHAAMPIHAVIALALAQRIVIDTQCRDDTADAKPHFEASAISAFHASWVNFNASGDSISVVDERQQQNAPSTKQVQ